MVLERGLLPDQARWQPLIGLPVPYGSDVGVALRCGARNEELESCKCSLAALYFLISYFCQDSLARIEGAWEWSWKSWRQNEDPQPRKGTGRSGMFPQMLPVSFSGAARGDKGLAGQDVCGGGALWSTGVERVSGVQGPTRVSTLSSHGSWPKSRAAKIQKKIKKILPQEHLGTHPRMIVLTNPFCCRGRALATQSVCQWHRVAVASFIVAVCLRNQHEIDR